jgi:hypothetical protein
LSRPIRIAVILLWAVFARAQVGNARLEGLVQDSSGAAVPRAQVLVRHVRAAFSARAQADPQGFFVFLSLPAGEYDVSVGAPGFRTVVLTRVGLNAAATLVQNVRLELGPVTESVTVRAREAPVQNADSEVGQVVAPRDIDVLPQLERNPIILAIFQSGVQIRGGNIGFSRINGTGQGSNSVRVDGIDATESVTPALAFSSNLNTSDSIAEFRIITQGGKAEFGTHAGAQIEMVTRSGTNRWSGNLFEHFRNTALNANDFFNNSSGVERPKFIQNVFGGSLGGPVIRSRTFLFGTYQGTRTRQGLTRNRTVLTPQARAGLFRWVPPGSTAVAQFDIVRSDPRGIGIDREVAALIKLTPEPNNFDMSDGLNWGNFRFNSPYQNAVDNFTVRADHHMRNHVRLFFRLSWLRADYTDSQNDADERFPGQLEGTARVRAWSDSFGADWTPSAGMVNEFRFGRNGMPRSQLRPARLPGPMLSPNTWASPLNTQFPSSVGAPSWELTDHFSVMRGRHLLKTGLSLRLTHLSATSESTNEIGIYPNVFFGRNFGNSIPASVGPPAGTISTLDRQRFEQLYNDLLGRMARVSQIFFSDLTQFLPAGTARVRNFRSWEYSYFVQDDWRVRRNLTLNLGLRYEFPSVPAEQNGFQGTVDRAAALHAESRISNLTIVRSSSWYDSDLNNFAPRVGLAWDPRGDGRTAVRAQYGIFYDGLIGNTIRFVDANTPGFSQVQSVYPNEAGPPSDRRVSDGIKSPDRPAAPELRPPNTRQTTLALFKPHFRTGYVQHYSLTLQRELARNTVLEAGFIGTRGVKLFMVTNLNQLRIQEGFLNAFRELQAFRTSNAAVPAGNTLVRLFGSVPAAITAVSTSALDEGSALAAADNVDRVYYGRYAAASLNDFYLRNFPQFNMVALATNDGRSYYDSLQVSVRRQTGPLRVSAHYTFSKSIDNIQTESADPLANRPVDSFNLRLGRALSDADRTHVFNTSVVCNLPFGTRGRAGANWPRLLKSILGSWDVGLLAVWESGAPFSVRSGRRTGGDQETYANFAGSHAIGNVMRRGDGVYWFTPGEIARFSFPAAGEIGTSGRNAFRGPRYFDTDLSLIRRFGLTERGSVALRAEFYNLFNNVNFANPGASLLNLNTLGKFGLTAGGGAGVPVGGTSGGPRIVQMVLRYDF